MTVETLKQFTQELAKKVTFNTENLYVHTISLNVGSGRRIVFDIINNNGFDMSWAEVKKYIQDNYSASSADVITYARFMPCVGVSGNYTAIGFAWATNRGGWVICYPVSSGIDWSGVSDDSNIYILSQKTRLLALNNVNKPSYKEFTTNLTYNGSKIGDIKWTCYKYPLGDGKFRYSWKASGYGSANITWEPWSSSTSWSYVTKLVSAEFPSGYNKIYSNGVFDFNLYGVVANLCKDLTSTVFRAYFERPSTYASGSQNIYFTGSADYIAN